MAVVGGGLLGLTLALRLCRRGHRLTLFEAEPELGGLCASQDYGDFTWDRFYHVVLPQDIHYIHLIDEIGLGPDLRWRRTGTGYVADGRFYDMNGMADWLRFPLLSISDKARLGGLMVRALTQRDPRPLFEVCAKDWLSGICGRTTYEVFWQPLLQAKFGPYADQVAAVFIWATLRRLLGARSGAAGTEHLGYVSGGTARVIARLATVLSQRFGALLHLGCPVRQISMIHDDMERSPPSCEVRFGPPGSLSAERFDQVFFTGPTALARPLVSEALRPVVQQMDRVYPSAASSLGVICLALTLDRPLGRYYVLNIADERVRLTGLVEMTALVDRHCETYGLSLIYLPRYLDSQDPLFEAPDASVMGSFLDEGLLRLFPGLDLRKARYLGVHRARHVQPLPLPGSPGPLPGAPLELHRPLCIVNTALLTCATLNNNEVVGLAARVADQVCAL